MTSENAAVAAATDSPRVVAEFDLSDGTHITWRHYGPLGSEREEEDVD